MAVAGLGSFSPKLLPSTPLRPSAGVQADSGKNLYGLHVVHVYSQDQSHAGSRLGVKAAALGVGVTFVAHARGQRRKRKQVKIRLKAGGEEIFDGSQQHQGVQLLLAEGLGPYVSKNFNERRDMESQAESHLMEVLASREKAGHGLTLEDRLQINHSMLRLEFLRRLDALEGWQPDKESADKDGLDNISIKVLRGRGASLPPALWNELLASDDSPFLEHHFLSGLEETGCVNLAKGWQPRFLLACRAGRSGLQLMGAVPMYLKMHSEGEFCEEAEWIEASRRHERWHWPRLFVGVPFTPHKGRRLITAAWLTPAEQSKVEEQLLQGLRAISARTNSSLNIAFASEGESKKLHNEGFVSRTARQAWWTNRTPEPYSDFNDFLRMLRLKNAREIAKQRSALREVAGVRVEVIDGSQDASAVTPELMSEVYQTCYMPTQLKHGNVDLCGGQYRFDVTEDFFRFVGEHQPHRVLLVLARDERQGGALMGGSFCFIKDGRISGRYWGFRPSDVETPFLHFECCYYAVIEHAIEHRYKCIEPGNGGGDIYKVQRRRGFEPVLTCSYHFFPDPDLQDEVASLARAAASLPSWTAQRNSAYAPTPREPSRAV